MPEHIITGLLWTAGCILALITIVVVGALIIPTVTEFLRGGFETDDESEDE